MQVEPDYYAVLQLQPGASIERVRDHYRRLAKVFHPDRNAGDAWCHEQIKRINIAFEFLSDPQRKAAYDARKENSRSSLAVRSSSTAVRPPKTGSNPRSNSAAYMPIYEHDLDRADRPRWGMAASWLVMLTSLVLFGVAIARHAPADGGSASGFGAARQMMLLPSLHTGLMDVFTGGGPQQVESAYKNQLSVLTDSAQSGLDDANDTMEDLKSEDVHALPGHGLTKSQIAEQSQRSRFEAQLRQQAASLVAHLTFARRDMARFDWTSPGVRRRLRVSTIDQDLEAVDESIDPLHNTVCNAQEQIVDSDPYESSPTSTAATAQLRAADDSTADSQ